MRLILKHWTISTLACAGLAGFSGNARAESSAVLVLGKATPKEQTVIAAAITGALKQTQWSVIDPTFTVEEVAKIGGCLADERPWPCIAPYAAAKGIGLLFVIETAREKAGGIRLVGKVTSTSDGVPQVEQQYCNPCSETSLAKTSATLAKLLVDSAAKIAAAAKPEGPTGIEVHVTPANATILLDDQPVSATNGILAAPAGSHHLAFQLAGYRRSIQEVTVTDGETTRVEAALVADVIPVHAAEHPSNVLPISLIAGGGAAVAVGLAISLTAEPGPKEQRHEYYYSGPALVLAGAGVAAVGVGIYLLIAHRDRHDASPTVAVTTGGAFAGWTTSF